MPALPIGVATVVIHLVCSLRIEHPAPVKGSPPGVASVKGRLCRGSLAPGPISSASVAIPPPIPHRSHPSQPPPILVAGRTNSRRACGIWQWQPCTVMRSLPFLMWSLRLGCHYVIFVCSCTPVFRFARPVVPDFVCLDLGEVVIHNDVGGACICLV
jgi:hypothetical protein